MRHAWQIVLYAVLAASLGCGGGGGSDDQGVGPTSTPVATATPQSTPVAAANAWSVGDRAEPGEPSQRDGIILRSSDAGAHWTPTFTEANSLLAGVSFADATRGWAVGFRSGSGEILRSDDSGLTWSSQRAAVSVDGFDLTAVQALSREKVVAVGGGAPLPGTADAPSLILRTGDAGVTWTVALIAAGDSGDQSRTRLSSVCITSAGMGIAVGSGMSTRLGARTSDAGITWTDITTSLAGTTAGELFDVACLDDEFWVATNGATFARYSADSGQTWGDVAVPANVAALTGISAPARGVAVAVGLDTANQPLIIRTDDAGGTWTRQPIDLTAGEGVLNDVSFAGPDDGTAVGEQAAAGSLTVVSPAQGSTWTSGTPLDGFVRLLDVARIP